MVDIEHKSLELIRTNLNDLNGFLNNKEIIKMEMNTPGTIDAWSIDISFPYYVSMLLEIIQKHDFSSINEILTTIPRLERNETDTDVELFLTAILDFVQFTGNVYEIYMLDQLLFILRSASLQDIGRHLPASFKTGSCFEENAFGLAEQQEVLFGSNRLEYEKYLYNLKLYYRKEILSLLSKPEYKAKWENIKGILESLIMAKQDNAYALSLYEYMCVFTKKIKVSYADEMAQSDTYPHR